LVIVKKSPSAVNTASGPTSPVGNSIEQNKAALSTYILLFTYTAMLLLILTWYIVVVVVTEFMLT